MFEQINVSYNFWGNIYFEGIGENVVSVFLEIEFV